MLFLKKNKDGGPHSNTTAYWLWEIKWLFSIGLLRFEGPSRDVYHSHAFNSIGWVLSGCLLEEFSGLYPRPRTWNLLNGFRFVSTDTYHKVSSPGVTWVFTIRGPWQDTWTEIHKAFILTLTHGRRVVNETPTSSPTGT